MVVTIPIRPNPLQYDDVPLSKSPYSAHYVTVPEITSTIHYGTSFNQDLVSVTVPIPLNSVQFDTCNIVPVYDIVPPSFVQGLYMPKRTDSCLRNKYTKKEKKSRTPLIVPRIIDHSKDVDPHLVQSNPLRVKTMDMEVAPLVIPELVPGAPEITRTGLCSNSSPIKDQ